MNIMSYNKSSAGRLLIRVLLFSPLSMIVGRFQIKMFLFCLCRVIAGGFQMLLFLSIQCDYRQ